MAAVTVISQVKYMNKLVHDAVNFALSITGDNSLLITKSVRDILFGYEDPFLKELKKIAPTLVPSETVGLFIGVSIFNEDAQF